MLLSFTHIFAVMNCAIVVSYHTGAELGYSNIYTDTVDGDTVLESGSVPIWLNGPYNRRLV